MTTFAGILGGALLTLLASLVLIDARVWLVRASTALVRRSAGMLPAPHADRYREEWAANAAAIGDAPLSALAYALWTLARAPVWSLRMRREGSLASQDTDVPSPALSELFGEGLNSAYTFDAFMLGDSNRLAHAASLAVAELPGQAYNPLVLYGPPGLGKTHLLHAIAHYQRTYGTANVQYMSADRLRTLMATSRTAPDAVLAACADVDVLLMDDIDCLQPQERRRLAGVVDALCEAGTQVVSTSLRMPPDLAESTCGLVADIRAPDEATRLRILRRRAEHVGIEGTNSGALELIAQRVETNVRALQGALIRLIAFSSLTGRPITSELAAHVLDGVQPGSPRPDGTSPDS